MFRRGRSSALQISHIPSMKWLEFYLAWKKRFLYLSGKSFMQPQQDDPCLSYTPERLQTLAQWWKSRAKPRVNTVGPKLLQNKEQKLYSHHENMPSFSLYTLPCYISYTGLLSSFLLFIYLLFKKAILQTGFVLLSCSYVKLLHNLKHSSKNDWTGWRKHGSKFHVQTSLSPS